MTLKDFENHVLLKRKGKYEDDEEEKKKLEEEEGDSEMNEEERKKFVKQFQDCNSSDSDDESM